MIISLRSRRLRAPAAPPRGGTRELEGRGGLVKGYARSSPTGPRRLRIVDPGAGSPRTLAYVEIPPGSNIDPEAYLGRIVGVRARGQAPLFQGRAGEDERDARREMEGYEVIDPGNI